MEKLLTQKEVAEILGTTTGSLNTLRWQKKLSIPYYRVGSKIMYKREDIENWLKDRLNA